MGLAMLNKHSKYMELIADFIEKKQKLGTDDWMSWLPETEAQEALRDLNRYMADTIDDEEFDADSNFNCLSRAALSVFAGAAIQPFFVKKFKEMSEEQLDDILQSFRLEQCDINRDLLAVYEKYVKE